VADFSARGASVDMIVRENAAGASARLRLVDDFPELARVDGLQVFVAAL
jgi:hypothetical protein